MHSRPPSSCLPIILAAPLGLVAGVVHAGLVFSFSSTGNSQADAAFAAAGARWSSDFTDNVTINVNAGFAVLAPGVLASTSTAAVLAPYTMVRDALIADATSADDATAVAHLPVGSVNMLINRTANDPNGAGSATPYLDANGSANNRAIAMTRADAKALGLIAGNNATIDANITFNSSFFYDFNPADGIGAGLYDFVGLATHELGHALGFISGVDVLDTESPPAAGPFPEDDFTNVTPLDLYRYSSDSAVVGAIDWTADSRAKYFSIDGGATDIALFATGKNFGDGRQASHWKDDLGIGVMDPTAAGGEKLGITPTDLRAFDVIGWNLASASLPEPVTPLLFASALLAGGLARRQQTAERPNG
ncbi:MAG TPA: NF038122 family metalloprotease [Accumulibacter sp.]|uniref:NF038122 family metalloprotease n=1 Tax=Accumulibacter sp. TaxID=2053492 RepID=UPI0025D3661D|nr:NF038122 family metalloprotease [Accumulibacter sp.]MCM8598145.1 NF038122 family metalloprotease [Accumulibacter sp.]MCM8663574.1 NF038122 family metalloprotease [Accumulibacter sp.]HNC52844.1 NF038122 family metalloprotease [Accumulibacter sp.]